jgi:hypothetical protein
LESFAGVPFFLEGYMTQEDITWKVIAFSGFFIAEDFENSAAFSDYSPIVRTISFSRMVLSSEKTFVFLELLIVIRAPGNFGNSLLFLRMRDFILFPRDLSGIAQHAWP